jgi:hypothetical protein
MKRFSARGNVGRWLVAVAIAALTVAWADEEKPPWTLANAVDLIGKEFVDPQGAELVEFVMMIRGLNGAAVNEKRLGWRRKGEETLFFGDRVEVPAGWISMIKLLGDATVLAAGYVEKPDSEKPDVFAEMRRTALGEGNNHLANAAWLERAGRHKEAGKALELALAQCRDGQSPLDAWRNERAWFYFAGMVHAFMQRQDTEAETYGELLLKRFPETAKETYPQAAAVLSDIRRRKNHRPPTLPEKLDSLPLAERIDRCIAALEEIDIMQSGQPGGVDLGEAPCVAALIAIGDPAVPRLLDVLENDRRLTRSVHYWRNFHPSRTVLAVSEAALTAVMSILRTEFYSPAGTGSNFTSTGEDRQAGTVRQLRAYWEKFGNLPFDARMMAVLTSPDSTVEARREAAFNLATPNAEVTLGTTVWTGRYRDPGGPNPVIGKFSAPTVAEAILAAADKELDAIQQKEAEWKRAGRKQTDPAETSEFILGEETFFAPDERRETVAVHSEALRLLGDRRIAATLASRANQSTDPAVRADWAFAADQLGDPSAVGSLRDALVSNSLKAPAETDTAALLAVFRCLTRADAADAMAGLAAMRDTRHSWHAIARKVVVFGRPGFSDDHPQTHPWCIDFLEAMLADTRPSGFTLSVEFDEQEKKWKLIEKEPNGNGSTGDGSAYVDEAVFDRKRELRYCDLAAPVLLKLLGDHAEDTYQPLSKQRNETITKLKHYLKIHRGRFRNLADHLDGGTGWAVEGGRFLPVLPQRTRAATREDVANGLALFALDDPGPPPAIKVPVETYWLARKPHFDNKDPDYTVDRQVVALQVERDSTGGLWFGVADGNGFFIVPAREIGSLWPLSDEDLGTGTR